MAKNKSLSFVSNLLKFQPIKLFPISCLLILFFVGIEKNIKSVQKNKKLNEAPKPGTAEALLEEDPVLMLSKWL